MLKFRSNGEIGSSILELALVAPFLTLLLITSAELGRMGYLAVEVQAAARAGAAYGSQSNQTFIDTTGMTDAAQNEASHIASSALTVTPTDSCVCETIVTSTGAVTPVAITGTCGGSSTTALTQCPSSTTNGQINVIVDYVTVSTSATIHTMFNYNWHGYGLPSTFTFTGSSKMRCACGG